MNFPKSSVLDINKLAQIFDNTSASYKFLLFKSIIDQVHLGKTSLSFNDLALRSISYAWYSIHFYKLSYGYSDKMSYWVKNLDLEIEHRVLFSDQAYHRIYEVLREITAGEFKMHPPVLKTFFREFSNLVPYRLISPWFASDLKGKNANARNQIIANLSCDPCYKSLYSIHKEDELRIVVNEKWADYIKSNYAIIEGWWRSKFINYLQKLNPTVLGLSMKLDPPIERSMANVKKCFKSYYEKNNITPKCFYTGVEIKESISHDHFLPWSFLGDDPIYNFVPTTRSINSSKSNSIPSNSYLKQLSDFQYDIFRHCENNHKKLFEAYLNDLNIDNSIDRNLFTRSIESFYKPLFLSAKNQGFNINWKV